MVGSTPNLPTSGTWLVGSSTASRTYTRAPGACSASFQSSQAESTAKRCTPAAWEPAMWDGGRTGLLESSEAGSTPSERSSSSSASEANSKPQPSACSRASSAGSGLHFTA